jgi:hypothetical protein
VCTAVNAELDLGRLSAPLLIFGGPYSNLQATAAMRRAGLSEGYARPLETERWPNLDNLLAAEPAASSGAISDSVNCRDVAIHGELSWKN